MEAKASASIIAALGTRPGARPDRFLTGGSDFITQGSIAQGNTIMSHNTGFACARLGRLLVEAGIPTVLAKRNQFDLWALAVMEQSDQTKIQKELLSAGLDFVSQSG